MTQPTPGLSGSHHRIITGQNGAVHTWSRRRRQAGSSRALSLPVPRGRRRCCWTFTFRRRRRSAAAAPPSSTSTAAAGGRANGPPWARQWTVSALSPIGSLVAAGFVVASADYRLSGTAVFPAQLQDAKAAVRWLRTHAADYDVDPDRIYAWGDSAGGHLASLVGAHRRVGRVCRRRRHRDAAVAAVAWYPPTDLVKMGSQALPDAVASADDPGSREALLLGAQPADAPEKAAAASPLSYVHRDAPPFFLAHGTADRFVPAAQSTSPRRGAGSRGRRRRTSPDRRGRPHVGQPGRIQPPQPPQATAATVDFLPPPGDPPLNQHGRRPARPHLKGPPCISSASPTSATPWAAALAGARVLPLAPVADFWADPTGWQDKAASRW